MSTVTYRSKHREELARKAREYYYLHQDVILCRAKQWNLAHKAQKREYDKQYRAKNGDKIAMRQQQWEIKNKSRICQQREANRSQIRDYNAVYHRKNRAQRFGMPIGWYEAKLAEQNNGCAICGRKAEEMKLHVETMIIHAAMERAALAGNAPVELYACGVTP